jgi:hypothetical protein
MTQSPPANPIMSSFWREVYTEVERGQFWVAAHDNSIALSERKTAYKAILERSKRVDDPATRKKRIQLDQSKVDILDDVDQWPGMKVLETIATARRYPPGHTLFWPAQLTVYNYNLADVSNGVGTSRDLRILH